MSATAQATVGEIAKGAAAVLSGTARGNDTSVGAALGSALVRTMVELERTQLRVLDERTATEVSFKCGADSSTWCSLEQPESTLAWHEIGVVSAHLWDTSRGAVPLPAGGG